MTELERTLAELACARLPVDYAHCVDSRDNEAFVALWSEDGVWHNTRGPQRGRATIRLYVENQAKTAVGRHVCSNVRVTLTDEVHATGTSYFTFYNAVDPGDARPVTITAPMFVGQYFDEYVKTAEGWKFASRRMELTFKFA